MTTQKAVRDQAVKGTRLRLRAEMKRFVESQDGSSETDRVSRAADAMDWSDSLVRQAMGRQVSKPGWLPQGANLVRFCHAASINAEWLFTGDDVPQTLPAAVAEHIASGIKQRATHTIRTIRRRVYVDGTRALEQLVSIACAHRELMQRNDNELLLQGVAARYIPESDLEAVELAKSATAGLRARLLESERQQPGHGLVIRPGDEQAVSGAAGHIVAPV